MTPKKQYRCPNCKHTVLITSADFFRGIAMVSCGDCGIDAFAIDDGQLR